MIVTFLRSSSIGTYYNCSMQYLMTYAMGLPSKSGKAAAKGNVVHKAAETLAWKALKTKEGVKTYEDETFGVLKVKDITTEWAVDAAYKYYRELEPNLKWDDESDLRDCHSWMGKLLKLSGGYYDPANMNIIAPEVKFEMTIEKPWAKYSYEIDGEVVEGYLGLKGTVDLITRDRSDDNIIECTDYKTGKQQDFNTGKPKDYDSLMNDRQLLLYAYALSHKYPGKTICISIIFINGDGAFKLFFGPDEIAKAEEMIKTTFNDIRSNQRPTFIDSKQSWKCKYLCTHNLPNPWDDSGISTCKFIHAKIQDIGLTPTMVKYGSKGGYAKYGSGGGRNASE